ncbi:MAG: 1-deoxy-D-xylulose-5-phosphate synthase, partial [Candidatus Thiodiazotropha sp. (ex Notomyrtea botanica)]|nr:1-deoxy-D-xylulose-5-phosphate synthase [Candidatus Thiodiazotropha sp. (ex Notomyrtea botanica)]
APADENECVRLLQTAFEHQGPAMVRYPRGAGPGVAVDDVIEALPFARGEIRREGQRVALLVFGSLLETAMQAAEQLDATVANMRFIKPLDESMVLDLANRHPLLVTIEENAVAGGAGSAVSEYLNTEGHGVRVLNLGLPDSYQHHASHDEQLSEAGLDLQGLIQSINRATREVALQLVDGAS